MLHLKVSYLLKMKVTKAVQKISTYQPHSKKTSRIHHISSVKNASFDSVPATPHSTRDPQLRSVHRRLAFSPCDDGDTKGEEVFSSYNMPQAQHHAPDQHELSSKHNLDAHINLEEEEDFQTASLDDKHWTTKEIPDRPLCVHEHSLPHGLCLYPCPYANYKTPSYYQTLDLSDISKFEDLMYTSSDEDIPVLKDSIFWKIFWFELNI